VAVLSYGYWQRRFAGDPSIVGKQIILNARPMTVMGVTPPGFYGTELARNPGVRVSHDDGDRFQAGSRQPAREPTPSMDDHPGAPEAKGFCAEAPTASAADENAIIRSLAWRFPRRDPLAPARQDGHPSWRGFSSRLAGTGLKTVAIIMEREHPDYAPFRAVKTRWRDPHDGHRFWR